MLLDSELCIKKAVVSGANNFLFGDIDAVQGAIEFLFPKIEEIIKLGEFGCEVIFLPDEFLQNLRVVGHVIENLRRRQAITLQLNCHIVV